MKKEALKFVGKKGKDALKGFKQFLKTVESQNLQASGKAKDKLAALKRMENKVKKDFMKKKDFGPATKRMEDKDIREISQFQKEFEKEARLTNKSPFLGGAKSAKKKKSKIPGLAAATVGGTGVGGLMYGVDKQQKIEKKAKGGAVMKKEKKVKEVKKSSKKKTQNKARGMGAATRGGKFQGVF